jgi:uncharacterized protein (DUF1499 family)
VTKTGAALSLLGGVLLLAGPIGSRAGFWTFIVGFGLIALSVVLGLLGMSLSVVGGFRTGMWTTAMWGIGAGLVVVVIPSAVAVSARGAPPIHEITTDPEDPPPFVAIVPLRREAPNPAEYGGEEVARQQRQAYPDIEPLVLSMGVRAAFDRALAVVRDLGWDVVDSQQTEGRIEAVDTTFWFGFKDDVVIRLRGMGTGTRVDVRSKSRVGLGDTGTNARRVRELLRRLQSPA